MSDTFQCDLCRGVFEKGDEEEARAELKQYFGNIQPEECGVVCDGCWERIHPDKHPHEVERAVADTLRARGGPPF